MILSKYVKDGRSDTKISVSDLPSKSNKKVSCRCDECGKKYIQRFSRDKDVCYPCRKVKLMIGNNLGKMSRGKERPNQRGINHARWNPNKTEFKRYSNKVRWLSEKIYEEYLSTLNPNGLKRTLCGIDGGYQLDHKISIKFAFESGMPIDLVADIKNLQLIPWKDNRKKSHK